MYTQCPECLTVFSLDGATIAQASGKVGCGYCGTTFDALASLTEDLPDQYSENLSLNPVSPAPPVLLMKVVRTPTPQHVLFAPGSVRTDSQADIETDPNAAADADADADTDTEDDADVDADAAATAEADAYDAADDDPTAQVDAELSDSATEPSFSLYRQRTSARRHAWRWALGCLLLALCLGAQLAWTQRATLIASARTGPWLRSTCAWLQCTLPAVSDTSRLQLLSRDVRPHPSVANALLISLAMRNDAAFRQPYPVVSITLSDLNDNRIAMRRFKPGEYISDTAVRAAGLAPGATAAVVFEVHDPGRNAVAFKFGFQ